MTRKRLVGGALLIALGLCVGSGSASAQGAGTGVAQSGMEQGEAVVAVRSDVRLAIKGIRATSSDRLAAMTREVGAQMPAIRKCYSDLVAVRATTVGGVVLTIVLEPGTPKPQVEAREVGGTDADLTQCVSKVVRAVAFRGVERPAAIEVSLSFDNTRARGQAALEERRDAYAADVHPGPDGGFVGAWRTDGGEIAFQASSESEAAVRGLITSIRSGFSAFVDCRRRAGRKGMNPEGNLQVSLRVARDGAVSATVNESTVQDTQRTPGCVEKALKKLRVEPVPRPASVTLSVQFGR